MLAVSPAARARLTLRTQSVMNIALTTPTMISRAMRALMCVPFVGSFFSTSRLGTQMRIEHLLANEERWNEAREQVGAAHHHQPYTDRLSRRDESDERWRDGRAY